VTDLQGPSTVKNRGHEVWSAHAACIRVAKAALKPSDRRAVWENLPCFVESATAGVIVLRAHEDVNVAKNRVSANVCSCLLYYEL
jgi:hypothetical protein